MNCPQMRRLFSVFVVHSRIPTSFASVDSVRALRGIPLKTNCLRRSFSSTAGLWKRKNLLTDDIPTGPVRPRDTEVKVLLLDEANVAVGVVLKRDAQQRAKDKDLKLVRVEDYPALVAALPRPSVHPVYMLMKGEDLHNLQMEDRESRKTAKKAPVQKVLQLTSTATDHDISTKIRQAADWLKKGDHVQTIILGRANTKSRMAVLHKQVMDELKDFSSSTVSGLSKSEMRISFLLTPADTVPVGGVPPVVDATQQKEQKPPEANVPKPSA